jgi:ketosteroid isomerase-like protein
MTTANDVRDASGRFYSALNRMAHGDARPMTDVWSHSAAVSTMHPIGGREVGWDQVKEPWSKVAEIAASGQIQLEQQVIEVIGDAAYEIGIEVGYLVLAGEKLRVEQRVTNIYRRENGAWKLVHHHTDLSPAMLDVLGRLQAQPG